MTGNGLPANDFLYLLSETVINVILTKFVCCVHSDLLTFQNWDPYTWLRIGLPTSHNVNRVVTNIALLHNTPLRDALGVDHVLTKYVFTSFGNISCKQSSQKCLIWISTLLQESCALAFHSGCTSARVVRNFADKVACFSRIVSQPIVKSHVKPWSVREHDATRVRLFYPFVFEQLRLI